MKLIFGRLGLLKKMTALLVKKMCGFLIEIIFLQLVSYCFSESGANGWFT